MQPKLEGMLAGTEVGSTWDFEPIWEPCSSEQSAWNNSGKAGPEPSPTLWPIDFGSCSEIGPGFACCYVRLKQCLALFPNHYRGVKFGPRL